MRRTSVGKYHIRLTLQTLTIGSATVVTKLQMPPLLGHQGIPTPRPLCHNAMNSLRMVGQEGLEPSTKGFANYH
jgi:hypothetical protein